MEDKTKVQPKFTFLLSAQKQDEPTDMTVPVSKLLNYDVNDPATYRTLEEKNGAWLDNPPDIKASNQEVKTFCDELGVYPSLEYKNGNMIINLWGNQGTTFLCNSAAIPVDSLLKGNVAAITIPFGLQNPKNNSLTIVNYKITVSVQDYIIGSENGKKLADPSITDALIRKYHNPPQGPQKDMIPTIISNQ